jgi:hypothetical protein
MRRSLQAYLAVPTVANVLFGWGGIYVSRLLRAAYLELLKAEDIPFWTLRALRLAPGFYALASVALVLGLVVWRRGASALCVHAAVGIVAADLGLLVYVLLGFVLPFFTLTWKI